MNFYNYFQSYDHYFFQWEDDAEVLAISEGNTIAYREYLVDVLEKLSHQGLPRFGTLLLTILATNINGKSNVLAFEKLIENIELDKEFRQSVIFFLLNLTQLPQKYKEGNNRLMLFQTLFLNVHNAISYKENFYFIEQLKKKNYEPYKLVTDKKEITNSDAYQDLRAIQYLSKRFPDIESIVNSLLDLPEIDQLSVVLKEDIAEKKMSNSLVDALIENEKTFHIGSLIKYIWGGLNIPFHSLLPSQQPMGGFSDLSNKGDFDKLLISEFANDDLIFLSRLANNEALYINREIPPQSNNVERIIIIDVSIKNWGTPKSIAYALMLAITNHPKTDIVCSAYIVGDNFCKIAINNIHEIIESIQTVEVSLHAANGLGKLLKECQLPIKKEVIFISSNDAFKQTELQIILQENRKFFNYWMLTDVDGNIEVYKLQQNNKKQIQHILLPLNEIWKNDKAGNKSSLNIEETIAHYPILFPLISNYKKIITTHDNEVFCIVSDSAVLQHFDKKSTHYLKGWKLIYNNLFPKLTGEFEIGKMRNGDYVLLVFKVHTKELSLINLTSGKSKKVFFDEWVSAHNSSFIFNYSLQIFHYIAHNIAWTFNDKIEENEIEILKESSSNYDDKILLYQQNEIKIKETKKKLHLYTGILKNIQTVSINYENRLVFNAHQLILNQNNTIKIKQSNYRSMKIKVEAVKHKDNTFVFPNGSSVFVNRLGMIVLNPSEKDLFYQVILQDAGSDKLQLIKEVKNFLRIGLSQAKLLIDTAPIELNFNLTFNEAEMFCKNINAKITDVKFKIIPQSAVKIYIPSVLDIELGVATEVDFAGNQYFFSENEHIRDVLNTERFWSQYINPFIQNIINYGTQN